MKSAATMGRDITDVLELLAIARAKLSAARPQRPTPFIDKTIYTNWNALCVSAYLHYARALGDPMRAILRCVRSTAFWPRRGTRTADCRMLSPTATRRPGSASCAAYSTTTPTPRSPASTLTKSRVTSAIFGSPSEITDQMISRFADSTSGGFFDTEASLEERLKLGALSARRKPYQDAPTPAGNPCAAIALLRLHAYTNDARNIATRRKILWRFSRESLSSSAFTREPTALPASWLARPHTQVVVVGEDDKAEALLKAASAPYAINLSVVHFTDSEAVAQNLPPVLAETIPNLPALKEKKSIAVVCTNFSCRPPVDDPGELTAILQETIAAR